MKIITLIIGAVSLVTITAPAQTTIFSETFNAASPNWTLIGTPSGIAASSAVFDNTDGNVAGSYNLNAGPVAGPDFVGFRYQVSGLNFGLGPVTVSFDGRIPSLVAAATHVRINGDFNGAIMGSFNNTTWTTWSKTFALSPGFNATAANWKNLTIGANNATVGSTAASNLRGVMTGLGLVFVTIGSGGTFNFDNVLVTGSGVGGINVGSLSGGTLNLSWVGNPAVNLQSNTNLNTSNWIDVPGTVGLYYYPAVVTGPQKYFRLKGP